MACFVLFRLAKLIAHVRYPTAKKASDKASHSGLARSAVAIGTTRMLVVSSWGRFCNLFVIDINNHAFAISSYRCDREHRCPGKPGRGRTQSDATGVTAPGVIFTQAIRLGFLFHVKRCSAKRKHASLTVDAAPVSSRGSLEGAEGLLQASTRRKGACAKEGSRVWRAKGGCCCHLRAAL